jgi:flagellar basal-body rod protein FlgC
MSLDALFSVTRAGLDYERMRMEAASQRIALADTPVQQRTAAQAAAFSREVNGPAIADGAAAADSQDRAVLDPSNPLAGPDGMVHCPDVDLAQEMTTLMSAQRAYQADIRAFNTLHGMLLKSLSIGGR